ncbi:MAG: SIS domain-containing protein [Deltaproteobacteria bacterium]|nr:SIS domain-containing protein [Deltaproteobacteria bacterium]
MSFTVSYLKQIEEIVRNTDSSEIDRTVEILERVRSQGGRLFFVGVGGSASNASHAVNDFRKICGMECYAPTDNVSELTSRINDEGWESSFAEWLRGSRLGKKDALFILSVGGGNPEKNVSMNIVAALKFAKEVGASVLGVVGRDGGFTKKVADACVVVPMVDSILVTFHAESFQSVFLHLIAAHPKMKQTPTKWESLQENEPK